ncbi:TetR/AcrR family transcriptional regulator [Conexibacter sp. JD483]|uniref:TetR/AcrR family transcriptional regulator n=1 Tax=unclassified Conexibacter TaxID=2627773 RepID=UPI00271B9AEF|nr:MULTISPECIES: TetR/AcrR family transcriptional regulator [unclassified Conexibacter]MDO8185219.1 TetR/AcrR family transcriptional regulator [Conexibacter sp. CPCC 205706]MDO8198265.1 TetR/AcrR family transcriptional regulator [Conexibacter sp. CPCC 205762]MDR9367773.1 TetR/AcrR family transcriptional regulator [Conexibacter sp. JD483]
MVLDAREQVLDAAGRLFAERGVQAVGMDAIRDAAGISLKRIYALFPSKEALVTATLREREQVVLAQLEAIAARTEPPRERILALFDLLADWFAQPGYRGCEFVNAFGELGPSSESIATTVRDHKRAWVELLERLVGEAGGSPPLAAQLSLLVNGAMVSAAIGATDEPAAEARAAAAVLLDAALPAAGPRSRGRGATSAP